MGGIKIHIKSNGLLINNILAWELLYNTIELKVPFRFRVYWIGSVGKEEIQ